MKKKTKKLMDSLMGFYEAIASIYMGSSQVEQEVLSAMLIREHINSLIPFHKIFCDKYDIELPELHETFTKYLTEWNDIITAKEGDLGEIVQKYDKNKRKIDYYS